MQKVPGLTGHGCSSLGPCRKPSIAFPLPVLTCTPRDFLRPSVKLMNVVLIPDVLRMCLHWNMKSPSSRGRPLSQHLALGTDRRPSSESSGLTVISPLLMRPPPARMPGPAPCRGTSTPKRCGDTCWPNVMQAAERCWKPQHPTRRRGARPQTLHL